LFEMSVRWCAVGLAAVGLAAVGLALVLSGCGDDDVEEPAVEAMARQSVEPEVFIAFERDFAEYTRWTTFDRGRDRVPPTHLGRTSTIYIDRVPPPGAARFPVGTRIVRVEASDADPGAWEVHAMVKRGGGFNAEGARDWEFFELALDATRPPSIRWRGEGPANGDGYRPAEGGDLLSCNHCHASAARNDSVLSPVLELSVTGRP
jgi:hypothetical protein